MARTIPELLRERAELEARLRLIPHDGTIEVKDIKGDKYLYVRKRLAGRLTSQYIGKYSQELHALLIRQAAEARNLKKQIRAIERQLAQSGYREGTLSERVMLNLDFARANVKSLIYDQAVLEGVSTTFPQTEIILENGKVTGVTPSDIQKIINLKHAWEFILDKDIITAKSDYHLLCHIARFINDQHGGRIRRFPVTIGGTHYTPPIPMEPDVKERIALRIETENTPPIDTAIDLCLYCMKTQIFNDGNKRASILLANHYLIGKGEGLLVIPEDRVNEFRTLLIAYYEGTDDERIRKFMKDVCWRRF